MVLTKSIVIVPKRTWDSLGKGFTKFFGRRDFGFIDLRTYYKLCLIVQTLKYMELEREKRQKHGNQDMEINIKLVKTICKAPSPPYIWMWMCLL